LAELQYYILVFLIAHRFQQNQNSAQHQQQQQQQPARGVKMGTTSLSKNTSTAAAAAAAAVQQHPQAPIPSVRTKKIAMSPKDPPGANVIKLFSS
jgi:hypothetical protein